MLLSKAVFGETILWRPGIYDMTVNHSRLATDQPHELLQFLSSMDLVHRAIQAHDDLEAMLHAVLDVTLDLFAADRAWLAVPGDPSARHWRVAMQCTGREFAGVPLNVDIPMDASMAFVMRTLLAAGGPVQFGPGGDHAMPDVPVVYQIQSQLGLAVRPKLGDAWIFGLHQCGQVRVWHQHEVRLFEAIGRRLTDALTSLLSHRASVESEQRLVTAQRLARVGYWEADLITGSASISAEACQMLGLPPEERRLPLDAWLGEWTQLLHPDDRELTVTRAERAVHGDAPYNFSYRVKGPDGLVRFVHSVASVSRDDHGRPTRFHGYMQDLTDLHRAEEARRASDARYRLLVDHAVDAVIVHGHDGTIVDVNPEACRALGFTRDELIGHRPSLFDRSMTPEDTARLSQRMARGELVTFESVIRRKDGTTFPAEVRLRPFTQNGVPYSLSIARDVSERHQLEEQLRQAQKMEAVGRLAGGVAHDFNNLLTVINGCTSLVLEELPADSSHRELLVEVLRSGDRAASLTSQLLAFSRKQVLQPRVIDITAHLQEVLKLLRRLIGEDIELTLRDHGAVHPVRLDPGQFDQAIINLAINARDAMPHGGRLTLEAFNATSDDGDDIVIVSVADTGSGMDTDTRSRIFEPFFTTKATSGGTGLGLAMVYGFVMQSGGRIDVESALGNGSTFALAFPRADLEQPERVETDATATAPGRETILLVEDADAVRALARLVLETAGYTVIEAANGELGLELFQSRTGIDLILTDLVMPRMNGWDLAKRVHESQPHLPVLFMSGYTDDTLLRAGLEAADIDFVQKPFSPQELSRRVREVLDAQVR